MLDIVKRFELLPGLALCKNNWLWFIKSSCTSSSEGWPGMSDVSLLSGIWGLSFDYLLDVGTNVLIGNMAFLWDASTPPPPPLPIHPPPTNEWNVKVTHTAASLTSMENQSVRWWQRSVRYSFPNPPSRPGITVSGYLANTSPTITRRLASLKPVLNIRTVFVNIVCEQCARIVFTNTFVLNTKTTLREPSTKCFRDDLHRSGCPVIDSFWSECCGGCGACYESQKTSKIKRNDGEVWRKPFRNWSSVHVFKNQPDRQKQHSKLGQSNSLPIMC